MKIKLKTGYKEIENNVRTQPENKRKTNKTILRCTNTNTKTKIRKRKEINVINFEYMNDFSSFLSSVKRITDL